MNRRVFLNSSIAALSAGFTTAPALAQDRRSPNGYIRTNWSRDPHSFGSYSYIARGSSRRHIRELAQTIDDTVFFAGEATHPTYNSTVHAAYESGVIAAESIASGRAQRVGIIGAGMSGLAAAAYLRTRGLEVTVLEARQQIGGRIRTDRSLGLPLELGASWIHGDRGNPLVELADRQNVRTIPSDDEFVVRAPGGSIMPTFDVPLWLEEVATIQHSAGASLNQINLLAYAIDGDYRGDDLLVPNGYDRLLNGLAAGVDILFNWEVQSVSYSVGAAQVFRANGESLEFDAVVVTLPLGVLKSDVVAFDPPLPAAKQTAINRLGMGVLDKVYLRYPDVFWDQDITWIATPDTGLPQGQFNQWLNLYRYTGQPIIMAFNGGQPARDLSELSDSDIVAQAAQVLARTYP